MLHLLSSSTFLARNSISPVAELRVRRSFRPMRDLAGHADHVLGSQLARLRQHVRPAFGIEDDLRLAVAVAEVDEHDAALIAVRIDPAAKRDFLTDVFRPQLAASMSAKQDQDSERKA